jgi:hypothetical protein
MSNRASVLRRAINRQKLTGTYEEIAAALNARPLIDNPVPRGMVTRWPTLIDVLRLLTDAERAKLRDVPTWFMTMVINALGAQDAAAFDAHVGLLADWQIIGNPTARKLRNLLAETQPDATWSAQITGKSWADENWRGRVTEQDVQAAMNRRQESDDAE